MSAWRGPWAHVAAVGIVASLGVVSCAEPPPQLLVVRAGRLLDGTGGPAQDKVRLTARAGIIDQIVADDDTPIPTGAAVVDARELTVLPGLIDVHTHLFAAPACTPGLGAGVGQALRNVDNLLRAGVTTAADLASPTAAALGLRRYVGNGTHRGPRLLVSGPILTAPGGYPTDFMGEEAIDLEVVRLVGSPADAVRIVRELSAADVDVIKVALQERTYGGAPLPLFPKESLCAVVDEAHAQELRVVAHAISQAAYARGLECRVDAFVHGALEPLSDDMIATLATAKTPVAPTLFVFEALSYGAEHPAILTSPAGERGLTDEVRENLAAYSAAYAQGGELLPNFGINGVRRKELALGLATGRANTLQLWRAGVPLAMGTDGSICFNILGRPIEELRRLQQAGLTAAEVVHVATSGSARLLGLHEAVGRLQVGYRADLIAVGGRPDETLDAMEDVRQVIVDGVVQTPESPGLFETIGLVTQIAWSALSGRDP